MYISSDTALRIKSIAKLKNISTVKMLIECDLNKNTLSTMTARGSWIQANSLAKIADYLGCSVDYLLGRTDNPDVNR
ncbi:MAG: helix-turn-helix domain-containing protein [Clostridiales bacterium]|nr:helix-turn-helix domain-containing protein [Clostridiales bacterium]